MSFSRLRRPLVFLALAGALAVFAAAAAVAGRVAPAFTPSAAPTQDRIPQAPSRWATDEAGFLSRQAVERLDTRLQDYERRTGHQLLVWIGRTIGENAVLEEWAVKAFEAWKVGRKGIDDGLVLFILAEDRKIRIEVGYGLEGKVPDIYAYRVIDNILAPGIRAGRPDEAVDAAVTALIGYISGDEAAAGEDRRDGRRGGAGSAVKGVFTGIVILVLIILFITNPSLALWLLINILSGGRGGGRGGWGGGGGGGFSGGGGRSGGGGASGGW